MGFSNRYLLFQRIDVTIHCPGHVIPIVRVKITGNDSLPPNEYEFEKLKYVQTSKVSYDIAMRSFKERGYIWVDGQKNK